MTPTKTECNAKPYAFGQLDRRQVVADFSGGQLTSDGGLLLVAQIDRRYQITERVAACFEDQRDPRRVQHELKDLIAQRLYGLVQGYEDLNDHEQLRHDRMFGIAVGKLESEHPGCAPLAGKSTLNRLEQAMVPPQVWDQSFAYRTLDSWSCERRVVCKLTYDANGARRHVVVTSFCTSEVHAGKLHADYYCPRGEMENRIKEHQLDLFSDRTSTHEFESNQLRLWFSSFAYILMQALRQQVLAGTELADAQFGTIRLKLLKVGAQIRLSLRRVVIAFSSAWSGQSLFHRAYQRLPQLPPPG